MIKATIGFNAGKVWRYLSNNGETHAGKLCIELDMSHEDLALALGWLARENKAYLIRKDGELVVSINDIEFAFG